MIGTCCKKPEVKTLHEQTGNKVCLCCGHHWYEGVAYTRREWDLKMDSIPFLKSTPLPNTSAVFKINRGPDITFEMLQADKDMTAQPLKKKFPRARIPFPEHLAPIPIAAECPICGKPLLLNAGEGCERDENGEWIATEIQLQCTGEPDFDSPDWDDWHRWHYSMPYVDWLPLEQRVLRAVRLKYYFRE